MPRKMRATTDVSREIGGLLRGLRKAAGFKAVQDAADTRGCPAARQTIYAYERGGLLPSLPQFLELVEFYAGARDATDEARYMAVAAIHAALASPAYHVPQAHELAAALQPEPDPGRRRRKR